MRMQTQWHISPMGTRLGLIYQSIPMVCKAIGAKYSGDLFGKIQLLELSYLGAK